MPRKIAPARKKVDRNKTTHSGSWAASGPSATYRGVRRRKVQPGPPLVPIQQGETMTEKQVAVLVETLIDAQKSGLDLEKHKDRIIEAAKTAFARLTPAKLEELAKAKENVDAVLDGNGTMKMGRAYGH